jgi:hypothetical protein
MNTIRSFHNVTVAALFSLVAVACGTPATHTALNNPSSITTTDEVEIYTADNIIQSERCESDETQPWVVNGSEEQHYETEAAAINAATEKYTNHARRSIRQLCPTTTIASSGIRLLDTSVASNK